ncbi:zinc finger protein 300-like isoform X3 [Planococcus citri]|uniref:zinc finger protein 300-like isoform X3 n=1 Tax=Planococcus citri TaxID=170843 RepID=UPI0031F951D6
MDLSNSFPEEKSQQGELGTSSDQVTSNQFKSNISCKIENDAYQPDQENDEPYEIQAETDEQFTKNEDLCVACGHVSAYEFFSFPINADIRQQWAKFCDINLDKIKPHFRLCDGHFKPEDYQITMQRRVLMPTSVPTLPPKVKHNFTPSIVNSFSMPRSNINTSQNTICSSDFEKNTTTADAPGKQFCRKFRDITNNHDTVPPKAAKLTTKKNLKLGKCQLLTKNFRSEIFRLKIRCSRLEDTFANFKNEIKQQVDECFVTRANTAGNVTKSNQNSTSSINASSENSRHNLCNTKARTDQRSVKDADGYSTDTSMASLAISIDDPQKVEVKPELFTEEVMLEFDEPAERVAEENHHVNSTISPPELSTDGLHNAVAKLEQFSNEVANAETSRNVTENNRCPLTTSSAENSNRRRCSTEDPPAQHFEEAPPEPENSNEDSQSPNSTIPSSETSHESRNNAEVRAGCSKTQENSSQVRITRYAKQKKHLLSVKKPTPNSSNVSNKVEVRMQNLFPYCCDICGAMFSYEDDWTRHQQQEHKKPFHCQVCDKRFTNKSHLIRHRFTHSENRPYKCSICDVRFKHNYSKVVHERRHEEGAGFECAECGKKVSQKYSLIEHLRLHSGVKPFSCQTCSKSFALKVYLTKHQRTHGEEKPYKCRFCDAGFKQSAHKSVHERVHVKGACFECTVCGKKFSYKANLVAHLRVHSGVGGVKPFSCKTCSKSFARKTLLTRHQWTHSEEKPFKCRICNQGFKSNDHKWRHERVHVKGAYLECADCGKKFSYKESLIAHLRLHSGVKPFPCQTCSKSFTQNEYLTSHQRTHTKEKPFQCRICNLQFCHQGTRAQHERFHVEGPRFECAHCGNKFRYKSVLANHLSSKCT